MTNSTKKHLILINLIFTVFLLLNLSFAYGQSTNNHLNQPAIDESSNEVICPSELPVGFLSPEEEQQQAAFEEIYRKAIQQKIANGTIYQKMEGVVYTIPVVVHIIHSGQEVGTVQNPNEATVNAYIEEANQHFSHTQAGAINFSNPHYGVDTEIQFCLASTDPDGHYTNGVVRHYQPEYYSTDYWKTSRFASEVVWDTGDYLNIFINYTTDVLGIYIGPNGVIMRNIGFNGVFFCHEVGHWLGLRHTFQGNSCANNDCLTDGDRICDTPPKSAAGLSGGCSSDQNLCTSDENDTSNNNPYRSVSQGGMGDQPDMIENYMDYTQTCYNSFTLGQKNRMRLFYETYTLPNTPSSGCDSQSKPSLDASINNGIVLDIPCGQNSGSPSIAIENSGINSLTSVDMEIYLDGILLRTDAWSGNLVEGAIEVVELSSITFPNGETELEIRLANPNGQTDDLPANNSLFESVYVVQGGVTLDLTLVLDDYPHVNSWELLDENGNVLVGDNIIISGDDEQSFICADEGACYTFVMYDIQGNGLCCSQGNGSYTLSHPDGTILASGGEFAFSDETTFCISDPCSNNGGDADNDGFCADVDCNDNDFYQGAPQTPGTACDDGNIATENDVIQANNCTCVGTLICPGYDEKNFDSPTLTHIGSGSSNTFVSFNEIKEDIRFTISNINESLGGSPNQRYIDEVTVSYRNAFGTLITFGTYTPSTPQILIEISVPLIEVIISLSDAYDGLSSTTMSVSLSPVGSCSSSDYLCASEGGDANDDGICDDEQVMIDDLVVLLQGPSLSINGNWGMNVLLSQFGLIPLTDPYANLTSFQHTNNDFEPEFTSNSLLSSNSNPIVDWLFIELRASDNPANVVATRSVLLRGDGQVVDTQGQNAITFSSNIPVAPYFVAIRHRNHLGVMTASPIDFSSNNISIDFSNPNLSTWGQQAQVFLDNDTRAMWAGNASMDDKIIFQGADVDNNEVFFDVLLNQDNNDDLANFVFTAYSLSDCQLDSKVIFQGADNENNMRFFNIVTHPDNPAGGVNFIIEEQLP